MWIIRIFTGSLSAGFSFPDCAVIHLTESFIKKSTYETLLLVESSTVLSGSFCSEILGFYHIRCACLVAGALSLLDTSCMSKVDGAKMMKDLKTLMEILTYQDDIKTGIYC